ncbi:hypothetical protein [Acinetobacter haemolyticus]|uniref:hypothetical protein n=1 Tax=Acinetobacter haemolyticus TaxID=29430 RepID=UPI00137298A7|nr:hypothetical protein [Acinetobacter haemolyticus]NAS00471.1 hypothetical protein [Acinetobacter haemolyticus]
MDKSESSYNIFDISHVESDLLEQLGTKSKFWYSSEGDEFLFKSVQSNTGERLGDDWAEKISCELAALLGLPHAYYELAVHNGIRGVITKNFISERGEQLMLGNELLEGLVPSVDDSNPNVQFIEDVYEIMQKTIINKPIGFSSLPNIKTASVFFVGYLMFDTLISNQDRHNENWGTIITIKGVKHLAPSYDHGASLARNVRDQEKRTRMTSKDKGQQIQSFVLRAKSCFLEKEIAGKKKRLKLLEAFRRYALMERSAAKAWLEILNKVRNDDVRLIIDRVPETLMTSISKDFTYELILCNKANLLAINCDL